MYPFPNIGILGGGQLGKMMAISVADWHLMLSFLDQSKDFPAGIFSHSFTEGNFKNYDDAYNFGKNMDVLSIEIEHVNTEALKDLEKEGKIIHPAPDKLELIKDKGRQKVFYQDHNIPTSSFQLRESKEDILKGLEDKSIAYPFVQKTRTAGYDGKGVAVIKGIKDLDKLMDAPSVIEDLVRIEKELAVIVARRASGEVKAYPVVEMEFNPVANLVEFLLCPAQIDESVAEEATRLAIEVAEEMNICGLLAVEQFLSTDGDILINEVAPRPHNSGHHTIDSCYTSQFEQHIRAILDMPLGSTKLKSKGIMVNLLGEPGHTGPAYYEGLDDCMAMEGVYVHIYGKAITKPYRKMGHVTVIGEDVEEMKRKAKIVGDTLKVITRE
jgi:5-(carboxyamino)imidazole ribonucleotide synthase